MAAGSLTALSVPPWGFWPLAFLGTAVLAWHLVGLAALQRALAGLLFSLGLFVPTLYWITEFHAVGYVALLLLEASFFTVACALTPGRPVAGAVALPAAFVVAEYLRGVVPFGGLPMGGIPLGQAGGPLAGAARIGGAYLVMGLAVALGSSMALAARRKWVPALALAAVPVIAVAAATVAPDGSGDGARPPLRVAIVQGGGARGFRAVEGDPGAVLDAHLEASRGIDRAVDLVLWPENAIDVPTIDDSTEGAALAEVARSSEATLVAGVTEDVREENFQNVAVAWAPNGTIVDRYVKAHRVPFGEYVPLRGLLEPFVDLSVLPRDAVAGTGPPVLSTPVGDLGVAISYEVFFGERGRAAARAGGGVLLVPTNAASFTTTQVPTQEVAAGQLRAWETGQWVVMSAPTGYGAVIDPDGRVVARTTLGRSEILYGEVAHRNGRTVYTTLGDTPVVLLALATVVLGVISDRRRLKSRPEGVRG